MRSRRRIAILCGLLVALAVGGLYALPEVVRQVAVGRLHALTGRPAAIDAVELDMLRGRLVAHGIRLAEPDGQTPFADLERLEVRLSLPALLRGHVWIRDLVLRRPVLRVVRLPSGELNVSDLSGGAGGTGGPIDLTVDRFSLVAGTVSLEDRARPGAPTWTSDDIAVEAGNLSTRSAGGHATASSVTGGARVSVHATRLRLHPVEFEATVDTEGIDLAPVSVYLPPEAAVVLDGGRATTSVRIALDGRDGLRVDATARFSDVTVVRPAPRELVAIAPDVRVEIADFAYREGNLRLGRLDVAATVGVPDPRSRKAGAMSVSTVQGGVGDLTWPATTDGRLDLHATIPGGGTLAVTGALRPPPVPSRLHVRLAGLDLAPWARLVPLPGRLSGMAEADLHLNEPLAAGVPAHVKGSVSVNRLALADAGRELVRVRRVEATDIEVRWPEHVAVKRVLVSGPRLLVERDRSGAVALPAIVRAASEDGGAASPAASPRGETPARPRAAPRLEVREVVVRDGGLAWRDEAVAPPVRLDVEAIDAEVMGMGWPLDGPLAVRLSLRPPAGGRLEAKGQVSIDPVGADLRIALAGAELAPYQAYVPTPARINGIVEADVAVVAPELTAGRVQVRGRAALSRLDVRDGERTIARIERAGATGLDVDWPARVAVRRLALAAPWVLVERDERGGLALRALLPRGGPAPPSGPGDAVGGAPAAADGDRAPVTGVELRVDRLTIDEGGLRVVDHSIAPPFGVDLSRLALAMEGLSTAPAGPARLDLSAQVGPTSELAVRGTMSAVGAPLKLDLNGELRRFGVPRANPYVQRQVAWQVREGWLTTTLRARVDGDSLSARTDVRLSQLQVVRAGAGDTAQARIGLPLGMLVALMKDGRGDITLSFPVSGRLADPRFDFREAIWSALRRVAVNAITLPVSWIGRVRMTPDDRIERIEVDPVPFRPGTATLTPEGDAQASRLGAFLRELPEVRVSLTPIASSADRAALARADLEATIGRIARETGLARDAAAAQLFEQRFPGRPVPATAAATQAALAEAEPSASAELPALAARRLEVVRSTVERAGIVGSRLVEGKAAERAGARSQVDVGVLEPEPPRPSPVRDLFRRLQAPFTGS